MAPGFRLAEVAGRPSASPRWAGRLPDPREHGEGMTLAEVLLYASLAGGAVPVGALVAFADEHEREDQHAAFLRGVVAFGGGVLLGAVALVLVPEGTHGLGLPGIVASFSAGSVGVLLVDRAIERSGRSAGQPMAMLLDFVPESIALGSLFARPGSAGPLLAVLIAMQNLPESFTSFRELEESGVARRRALGTLAPLGLLGPLAAGLGFLFLQGQDAVIGALALLASGGIVYLVFHDIAPDAFEECHWLSTLGASLGFLLAIVGEHLVA